MNRALVPDACGQASAPRTGRHILVVDDDESTRVIVSTILEDAGFAVESVGSPGEALQAVARSAPDLLILDLWLPGMDGTVLIDEIRALDRTSRPAPVIMLTAVATDAARRAAYAAGCQLFLTKPVYPDHLVTAVEKVLSAAAS